MKFGLRNGPWQAVFEGKFQKHDIEILSNPNQVMLVAIYEKEGENITGMVLQAFSIFSVAGEAETFVESLQREVMLLSRHDGKRTVQFLSLASKPSYAKASDEAAANAVDALIKELDQAVNKVQGVAKSFELHLTPLAKSSSAVKQSFFSQPAVIPMLVREKERIKFEKEEAIVEAGIESAAVGFGMTKDGKYVKEPLQMFQRTVVTDGTESQRTHVIQIITESFLLGNVPVIIFDDSDTFSGLNHPSKKIDELRSHGVEIEPIGFPKKEFTPPKNLWVNMKVISPGGFLQLFGCKDSEAEKILAKGLEKGPVEKLDDLIRNIESLESEEVPNQFLKRRVERIVKLADVIYPEMFAGKNEVQEIAKSWFKKIGRASIIKTEGLDPRVLTFLFDSLANELVGLLRQKGETEKPKLLIAIPKIEKIFDIKSNLVLKDFIKVLTEMQKFGIGFVIGSERRTDLSKEMLHLVETKAGIIKGNDVALDLPNSKNYRILVRPTLSRSGEDD